MNTVDCSPETVAADWRRIAKEHNVKPPEKFDEDSPILPNAEQDESATQENEPEHISGAEWAQQKQDVLGRWISAGLNALFVKLLKLDIPRDTFNEFANLSAEMLGKHHPNLSALEIIAKYERELVWGWSALMLGSALFGAFKKKRLESKISNETTEIIEGEYEPATK